MYATLLFFFADADFRYAYAATLFRLHAATLFMPLIRVDMPLLHFSPAVAYAITLRCSLPRALPCHACYTHAAMPIFAADACCHDDASTSHLRLRLMRCHYYYHFILTPTPHITAVATA